MRSSRDLDDHEGSEAGEPRGADPLETLVLPVVRSWPIVGLALALGAGVGLCKGLLQPNSYASVGKLLVRTGMREQATPETTVGDSDRSTSANGREALANEIELLKNPIVFQRAARELGPARVLEPYDPTLLDGPETPWHTRKMHELQAWWFGRGAAINPNLGHPIDDCSACVALAGHSLEQGLRIWPEPGSSVLGINYTDDSQIGAQEVVNAFLSAALAHHREVFETRSQLAFLNEQVELAEAEAASAQNDLSEYRISCSVYDIPEQRAVHLRESQALDEQLAADQLRLAELREQRRVNELLIANETPFLKDTSSSARTQNPEYLLIKQRLSEARLSGGVLTKIRELEKQLAETPQYIDAAPGGSQINPRYERLQQSLDEGNVEQEALTRVMDMRRARLSEVKQRLVTLEDCEPKHALLEREYQKLRARANELGQKRDAARIMSQLDDVQMSNLLVLQDATLPMVKSGPQRAWLLMLGAFGGALFGIALAFVRHLLDRRVRRPRDIERLLEGLPTCVVPEVRLQRASAIPLRRSAAI